MNGIYYLIVDYAPFDFLHTTYELHDGNEFISFRTARSTPPCDDYLQCVLSKTRLENSIRVRSTLLN
jgi:hypothetical protein